MSVWLVSFDMILAESILLGLSLGLRERMEAIWVLSCWLLIELGMVLMISSILALLSSLARAKETCVCSTLLESASMVLLMA